MKIVEIVNRVHPTEAVQNELPHHDPHCSPSYILIPIMVSCSPSYILIPIMLTSRRHFLKLFAYCSML